MEEYQKFIHKSRYAKWIEDDGKRESDWSTTVDRYSDFFRPDVPKGLKKEFDEAIDEMKDMGCVGSMRAVMTAGPALERDHVAGYNCSYMPIDHIKSFDELMYILMCGTGVGFSVERENVNKLPEISEDFDETNTIIKVGDSKVGWARAFRELIYLLYSGQVPRWDTSGVRPAGARLKTFGGRASGPEPLEDLFGFTCTLFRNAAGRKLTSLECHDLCNKIASVIVVGGVRRSALISLSNLSDDKLRHAKTGNWHKTHPHRALSNNSACYKDKPMFDEYLREVVSLYESYSGERGMFSRPASIKQAAKNGRRETDHAFGTNPCSEIILRPHQFCNLSEVVVRPEDTLEDLKRKVKHATILGTVQSDKTDFKYLRKIWKDNTEEERLLGVSLTGIMDHYTLSTTQGPLLELWLQELRDVAIDTNKRWAKKLGIPQSTAITCVKPSGTVSQLVDTASGIHSRYAPYYIRRVRADLKDPLAKFMMDSGFPWEGDIEHPNVAVFDFPVMAPKGSKCTKDLSAMDQLKLWKVYQDHWCEHKPSVTINYKNDEFLEVMQWVWDNFDSVSGVSFLPYEEHTYQQAPYEEITEEKYKELLGKMPTVDWEAFDRYENEDNTTGSQTLACTGTVCEVVDLV